MNGIVERLREGGFVKPDEAADLIETLCARVAELEASADKAGAVVLNINADRIALRKELAALKAGQGEPVFIVFDSQPDNEAPRFIEVETADGSSTSIDGWHEYPIDIAMAEGLWRLGPLYTQAPTIPEWQSEPLSQSYIQTVPDKCDRIVWRNAYYMLPPKAPTIPKGWQHVAATTLARFVSLGSPIENDAKWAEIADVAINLLSAAPQPTEEKP